MKQDLDILQRLRSKAFHLSRVRPLSRTEMEEINLYRMAAKEIASLRERVSQDHSA